MEGRGSRRRGGRQRDYGALGEHGEHHARAGAESERVNLTPQNVVQDVIIVLVGMTCYVLITTVRAWALSRACPELQRIGDRKARKKLIAAAQEHLDLWRFQLSVAALLAIVIWGLLSIARSWMQVPPMPAALFAVYFGAQGADLGTIWLRRDRLQRAVRKRMAEVGLPICVACGYDLTGATSDRCPECGSVVTREAEVPAEE
jgi:hypothetical protein